MPPTTRNLQDSLLAKNPRRALQNPLRKCSTHTEASCRSQTPSLPSSEAPYRSHHPHRSCSQALFRSHSHFAEPRPSYVHPLSRPRLITLPPSSTQSNTIPTMPLTSSLETRAWPQERGLGGYLKVIDAPTHPDAQAVARRIQPDTITNNVVRAALDLQRGGDHDVEIPSSMTLKEYFGEYSVSGKAYRTYGGSNTAFRELARILMEYVFVHTNPTSMP